MRTTADQTTPLQDAIETVEQAQHALSVIADHFQALIEGQLRAILTDEQRLEGDFAALRGHMGCTGVDADVNMLRMAEAVIGQTGRDAPLWLQHWIDQWPTLSDAELDAMQPTLEQVLADATA